MKLKLTKLLVLIGVLSLTMGGIWAQNSQPKDKKKDPWTDQEHENYGFWTMNCASGTYKVILGRIYSLAKHSYILDGNLFIREVTIDTGGTSLVRFYYIEPIVTGSNINAVNVIKDRTKEIADSSIARIGTNGKASQIETSVHKQYPTTSHAKTVEYRLLNSDAIDALYSSVDTAWTKGKGRTFSFNAD